MDPAQIPIRATTQDHLDLEDIKDDLIIFKDGSCCLVLRTTAVNFGLLSEAEQDATIYAYAGLLNSLSFPIQILIRSKKKDISSYLTLLETQEQRQDLPLLKSWIKKYRLFVERLVKENEVLDKKFYLVVPFSTLELGITTPVGSALSAKKKSLPYPKEYILDKAKTNLFPKKDHLINQLSRIGLKSKQLDTQQLVELYYRIYNPESEGLKLVSTRDYNFPLVSLPPESKPKK